jgi:hypothetical protein
MSIKIFRNSKNMEIYLFKLCSIHQKLEDKKQGQLITKINT